MPLKLCVGAASRRVTEEAARLRVAQVVASRRQVGETEPGYTGFTSATFAATVRDLSGGATQVVRDHGGPYQNGDDDDDWTAALDADADAGFDILHLDVSNLLPAEQDGELSRLCSRYAGRARLEVGGERDPQDHLDHLVSVALRACTPTAAVAQLGGRIWADQQHGHLADLRLARRTADRYGLHGVAVKAHNLDWLPGRRHYDLDGYGNVAPEFGNVEADAWLRVLTPGEAQEVLCYAITTGAWRRWFGTGEGTWFERARCALRYHLDAPAVARILNRHSDAHVRESIRDAIQHG